MKKLIIVCGAHIETKRCLERIKMAVKLWKKELPILFSGKRGRWENPEWLSESKYMRKIAKDTYKYPVNRLFVENTSRETRGNAYFSKKIITKSFWKKIKEIIVITSIFHKPRARYIFKKVFGDTYSLRFVSSPDWLMKTEIQQKKDHEKISLFSSKLWSRHIEAGDDKEIHNLLMKFPCYNKKSPYTKEQVQERFKTKNFPKQL